MNYTKQNKAQLIERIHELEDQTLDGTLRHISREAALLANDLLALSHAVYGAGATLRKEVSTFSLFK